tara:strand:+ start:11163 stop:12665 length:1503 start_codon:yes stop_codon:yes gene_type:complete
MPKGGNNAAPVMPDMSALLESVINGMPGVKDLPKEEKKKMKRAIRETSEKVKQLDLESLIKDSFNLTDDNNQESTKVSKRKSNKIEELPPPPPSQKMIEQAQQAQEVQEEDLQDQKRESKKKKRKSKKLARKRTPDKLYELNLSLEELYKGQTNKKLTVRVDRRSSLSQEDIETYSANNEGQKPPDDAYKFTSTKIKHAINDYIEPGMIDEDTIIIRGQADEAENHETGDIVATIVQDEHELFERDGSDLWILNKKISLAESYKGGYKFNHLDGRLIEILPKENEPLHLDGGLRRIPNAGMPVNSTSLTDGEDGVVEENEESETQTEDKNTSKNQEYGDLYIQFELDMPTSFDKEKLDLLTQLCEGFTRDDKADINKETRELLNEDPEKIVTAQVKVEKVEDPYDNAEDSDEDDFSEETDEDSDDDEDDSDEDDEDDEEDETSLSDEYTDETETESDSEDEEGSVEYANRMAEELIAAEEEEGKTKTNEQKNKKKKRKKP